MCLMSLDKAEAVPVDTHVWQISKRDYNCAAGISQKTLTDKVYKDIGKRINHEQMSASLYYLFNKRDQSSHLYIGQHKQGLE